MIEPIVVIDSRTDAQIVAVKGVACAAASAMSLSDAGCALTNQVATADKCLPAMTCDNVGSIIHGGLPTGHVPIGTSPPCAMTAGGIAALFVRM